MDHTISFYQTPSPYTDPTSFRGLFQALPDDDAEIIRFIKNVLIHPLDARAKGVRFNYQKAVRSGVDHRSIDDILANPQVHALLSLNDIELRSEPAQRGILSCDHHAVFFATILRLKSRAVRARCGYAADIVPGELIPHWVCEVYDPQRRRWHYVDPERVRLKLKQGAFLPAGEVWLAVRQHKLDAGRVHPDYPRRGLDAIKYRLLCDLNALMKQELLHYDWLLRKVKAPGLFSKQLSRLEEGDCIFLEIAAALSLEAGARWSDLCDLYASYVHAEHVRSAAAIK